MKILPFLKGEFEIYISEIEFKGILKKKTIKGFDIYRWLTPFNNTDNNIDYECEIYNKYFKIRRLRKSISIQSPFIGTIVYGKIYKYKEIKIIKYYIIFNVFTNILFLITNILFVIYCVLNNQLDLTNLIFIILMYFIWCSIYDYNSDFDLSFLKHIKNVCDKSQPSDPEEVPS